MKRKKSNLFRDINLPDELDGFDFLFEKSKGKVISQSKPSVIKANDISPEFQLIYNELLQDELKKRLKFHPNAHPEGRKCITELIKKYWCCFCKANVPIPIRNYKCHIDTRKARPTVAKNI